MGGIIRTIPNVPNNLAPGTPGSTRCGIRAKCSDTSKDSNAKSKKPLVDMYVVFDWMEVSISRMILLYFFKRKGLNENSLADTLCNKTVQPSATIGISSK